MTLREVRWRIEEEQKRENRMLERQAQLACWLINSKRQKKDHIKPHQLVRFSRSRQKSQE